MTINLGKHRTPYYDARDLGCRPLGLTHDNTPALVDALPQLPRWSRIHFPDGVFGFGSTVNFRPCTITGNRHGTRIVPLDGFTSTTPIWSFTPGGETTSTANGYRGNHGHWSIDGITFVGRGRTVAVSAALEASNGDNCDFANLRFISVKGRGLYLTDSMRDSRFYNLNLEFCGDASRAMPALHITSETGDVSEGCNNLSFLGLWFYRSFGHHIVVEDWKTFPGLIREIFFTNYKIHGQFGVTTESVYENVSVATDNNERGGVLLRNARDVFFTVGRWNDTSPGTAELTLADHPGGTSVTSAYVDAVSMGNTTDVAYSAEFTGAAGNQLTATGHKLTTGAMVQASASTVGSVSTATDYFIIRVDANTISLATTYNNALAGTAMTTGSSGTATLAAQDCQFLIASNEPTLVIGPRRVINSTVRPTVVSKAATNKVSVVTGVAATAGTFYDGPA